ncbi:MAG: efflux RND transporter periplasmic adaptor subunit, partial [Propionivibrio sp.]|nr:efflux RND transporter periplasmic adaptor subunit [Propionivibrio sp.]
DVLMVPNAALRFKPADADEKKTGNATGNGTDTQTQNGAAERGNRKGRKHDGTSGTVYVVDGKTIRPVAVELGITDNRMTEISSGELKAGDIVVVGEKPTGDPSKPSSVGMRLF